MARVGITGGGPQDSGGLGGLAGALGAANGASKPAGGSARWSLPELDASFRLDPALDHALGRATAHFNHALAGEGLVVRRPQAAPENGDGTTVEVAEQATDAVLRTYSTPDFLKFYATREKTNGVVVDGQV